MSEGRHHIWPTSRHGSDDDANQYPLDRWGEEYEAKHTAWHVLFGYMTPFEVKEVIRHYLMPNGDVDEKFFSTSFCIKEGLVDLRWKEWIESSRNDKTDKKKREKKYNTWLFLFGSRSALDAIAWIEREFIHKKWHRPPESP